MRATTRRGFTTTEIMIAFLAAVLVAAVCIPLFGTLLKKGSDSTAPAEARLLNVALGSYQALGAPIPDTPDPAAIIDLLKKPLTANAQRASGGISQLLAANTGFSIVDSGTDPRVVWDQAAKRFQVTTQGTGFRLNNKGQPATGVTDFAVNGQHYATKSNWIWDYDDTTSSAVKTASPINLQISGPTDPITTAGAQNFTAVSSDAGAITLAVGADVVSGNGNSQTYSANFAAGSNFTVPVFAYVVTADGRSKKISKTWTVNIPGGPPKKIPVSLVLTGPQSLLRSGLGTISGAPADKVESFPWTYTYKDETGVTYTETGVQTKDFAWSDPASRGNTPDAIWTGDVVTFEKDGKKAELAVKIHNYHLYAMTVMANPINGGTAATSAKYDEGSVASVTATPNGGFHFVSWKLGGAASKTVVMDADKNDVANFEPTAPSADFDATARGGSIDGQTVVADPGNSLTVTLAWNATNTDHQILSGSFFSDQNVGAAGSNNYNLTPGNYTASLEWWQAKNPPVQIPDPNWVAPTGTPVDPSTIPPGMIQLYNLEGQPMEQIPASDPVPAGRWTTPTGGAGSSAPLINKPDGSPGAWDGSPIYGGKKTVTFTISAVPDKPTVSLSAETRPAPGVAVQPISNGATVAPSVTTGTAPITIKWQTTNCSSPKLMIDGAAIQVVPTGQQPADLKPGSHTITVFAENMGGSTSQTITINVSGSPDKALDLQVSTGGGNAVANGATIPVGSGATVPVVLSWTSNNIGSLSLSGVGAVSPAGSQSLDLAPGSYTYTLAGDGLSSVRTFTIQGTSPLPIITFSAKNQDTVISEGGNIFANGATGTAPVLFTWSITNSTSQTLDGAPVDAANFQQINETVGTHTHTIMATGDGGKASQSITYTVNVTPPTLQFTTTTPNVPTGGSVSLNWVTKDASSITIWYAGAKGGSGNVSVNGKSVTGDAAALTGLPDDTYTFVAEAVGAGGKISQSVTVVVGNNLRTDAFWQIDLLSPIDPAYTIKKVTITITATPPANYTDSAPAVSLTSSTLISSLQPGDAITTAVFHKDGPGIPADGSDTWRVAVQGMKGSVVHVEGVIQVENTATGDTASVSAGGLSLAADYTFP